MNNYSCAGCGKHIEAKNNSSLTKEGWTRMVARAGAQTISLNVCKDPKCFDPAMKKLHKQIRSAVNHQLKRNRNK